MTTPNIIGLSYGNIVYEPVRHTYTCQEGAVDNGRDKYYQYSGVVFLDSYEGDINIHEL